MKGINKTFQMNGHPFMVDLDVKSKSTLNISKTPMYVPEKDWGYNYLQWLSFSGEEIDLTVYSHIWDVYKGSKVYPDMDKNLMGGLAHVYDNNPTPHGILKYWAQNFVTVHVGSTLHSIEGGAYKITEFSQSQVNYDVIKSDLTLVQYEQEDMSQTYWTSQEGTNTSEKNTGDTTGTSAIIMALGTYSQTCTCSAKSPDSACNATIHDDVKTIQKYMRRYGYYPTYNSINHRALEISGKYCYYTKLAVASFQKDNKLTVTGTFNKATKQKLRDKVCNIKAESS